MTPEEREQLTIAAYRALLDPANPQAQLIWDDLGAYCGVGRPSLVAGDPQHTGFQEGRRDAFLFLVSRVGGRLVVEN